MDEYLTTKQVQELLKVDRITIYRMLNDGRLQGVKIGNQWRFSQKTVDRLLSGLSEVHNADIDPDDWQKSFPTHCVQTVQNVFADLGSVGAVTVDLEGRPLTEVSNPCSFCAMVLSSPHGSAACQQSWSEVVQSKRDASVDYTCHAGLHYRWEPIRENDRIVAWLLAGQFYLQQTDPQEQAQRISLLAERYGLEHKKLLEAAQAVVVLSASEQDHVESWPGKVSSAIEGILAERAGLINRLNRIAELAA